MNMYGPIDNKLLIREVKKRPEMYDKLSPDYMHAELKQDKWQEIAELVFKKQWANWNYAEKMGAAKDVHRRWNNLRTCFSRELRERNQNPEKYKGGKNKYRYYNRMLFLEKYYNPRPGEVKETVKANKNNNDNTKQEDSKDEVPIKKIKEEKVSEGEEEVEETPITKAAPERRKEKVEPEKRKEKESKIKDNEPKKVESKLKETITNDVDDQDVNFALSLVPMFRKIPMRQKIRIQIEILKLFEGATE